MSNSALPTQELPFVSVVICTYNREQILCDTIGHMLGQDYPRFEIIVVDQTETHEAATQACLEALIAEGKIRYLFASPPGLCRARNAAIRAAKGPVVLFVDDDILPSSLLIRKHAAMYATDSAIGGVAGAVLLPDGRQVDDFLNNRNTLRDCLVPTPASPRNVAYAVGCNMSYHKDVLMRVGLFDEGYGVLAFMEEADLAVRVRKTLGLRIAYQPEALAVHLRSGAGGCRTGIEGGLSGYNHSIAYWRSVARFYLKHHGTLRGATRLISHQLHFFRLRSWVGRRGIYVYPLRHGRYAVIGFVAAWRHLRRDDASR